MAEIPIRQETRRDGSPYDPHTRAEAVSVGDKTLDEVLEEIKESIKQGKPVEILSNTEIDTIWNENSGGVNSGEQINPDIDGPGDQGTQEPSPDNPSLNI